jgi:arsenical-resistance protein 2
MMESWDESTGRKDFILIDLRRTDHEVLSTTLDRTHAIISNTIQGGTIRGSINLPAQGLYPTIPTLYALFKAAGLRKLIWYCCR